MCARRKVISAAIDNFGSKHNSTDMFENSKIPLRLSENDFIRDFIPSNRTIRKDFIPHRSNLGMKACILPQEFPKKLGEHN